MQPAFVRFVYTSVLRRNPDAAGLGYWTGRLRAGWSRGRVMTSFSESSEGRRRLAGPTNITLISLAMLGSVPSPTIWNAVYPTVDLGEKQPAWIAQTILLSSAYSSRFV